MTALKAEVAQEGWELAKQLGARLEAAEAEQDRLRGLLGKYDCGLTIEAQVKLADKNRELLTIVAKRSAEVARLIDQRDRAIKAEAKLAEEAAEWAEEVKAEARDCGCWERILRRRGEGEK